MPAKRKIDLEVGDWIRGTPDGSWRKVLKFLLEHNGAYDIQDIMAETGLAYSTVKRAAWKIQKHPNIRKSLHPEKKRSFIYEWNDCKE